MIHIFGLRVQHIFNCIFITIFLKPKENNTRSASKTTEGLHKPPVPHKPDKLVSK